MRRQISAALAALVLGASALVAASSPAAAATAPPKVLVLGDSYTAGNGAWNPTTGARTYEDLICWRSPYNYGQQFATAIGAAYKNSACSGAVIANLTGPQGIQPAQINAVDTTADVVVLTIGGNDLGFATIVENCFAYPWSTGASCKSTIEAAQAKLPAMEQNAYAALAAVRAKMRPNARLVYVGYPDPIVNSSYVWTVNGAKWDMVPPLRKLMTDGEAAQKRIVDKLNANASCQGSSSFLSVKTTFAGHGVDLNSWTATSAEWLHRISTGTYVMESYHPKPAGWGAEATLLTNTYRTSLTGSLSCT